MKNTPVTAKSSRFPLARKIALGSLACASLVASALAQPRYAVTDLGVLPGRDTSVATGLNDRGDIVGYSMGITDPSGSAVVWRNGAPPTSLGKLTGGIYSAAAAINSQGAIVGDGDTGNSRPQSWVTTANGLYNFFPNNGGNTHAIFIGDTGFIGGYYTKSLSGNTSGWHGSIWTPDPKDPRKYRQTDLPMIPGINSKFTSVISWAFNQSGQAAGWAVNDIIGQHACFWNNDASHSIVDLGTLPGDWSSIAWGMNSLGQVVGESHPAYSSRPVVWNNDATHTAVELPLLPGDNYGTANAINSLGQILGSSAYALPGTWNVSPARLVIWRDSGVFELQSVLDANTSADWTLSTAAAINNLGQIVGLGVHNGQNRAYLLTPITQ